MSKNEHSQDKYNTENRANKHEDFTHKFATRWCHIQDETTCTYSIHHIIDKCIQQVASLWV